MACGSLIVMSLLHHYRINCLVQDGRLLLDNTSYLCVQSKSGYEALREGTSYVS